MKKYYNMFIMLSILLVIFGAIFIWKWYIGKKITAFRHKYQSHIATVSACKAVLRKWQSYIQVVGSARSAKGIYVTTERAGMVTHIHFTPGSYVNKGDLLVSLDIRPELAELKELQAKAEISEITYNRNKKQLKVGGISQETLDRSEAIFKRTTAAVLKQEAIISQKTIYAPFSGKLGISLIYPGQYIRPGDKITRLETNQPIYIDFYIPQKYISKIHVGQIANITIEDIKKQSFKGVITTINPALNSDFRNVLVEVTLANKKSAILPGMFSYVAILIDKPHNYITIPQIAVDFNSYGSIIYKLKKTNRFKSGKLIWQAKQTFIKTGDTRGNQVAIIKGVHKNDVVVVSGQLKIKNNSYVVINNSTKKY